MSAYRRNFHKSKYNQQKIRFVGSQFICLLVILIDFVFRTGKNYYSQVFSQKCKYVVEGKRTTGRFFQILIEKILMK